MDRDSSLGMIFLPWKSTLSHWYSHHSFVLYAGSAKSLHVLFARNSLRESLETRNFKFRDCKSRSTRLYNLNLFNTANWFLSKDRFKKKSIWKKNISIKYFCKINVFFLRHLPYRLSFIFLLYFHIKIRVLYIFINNPFVVNFQNIVQIRSDERIEGKREKRFDISLVVNGGNIS